MLLNDSGILRLAQNLQQVIITNEVEAGELVPFLLQEIVEGFLASLQLFQDRVESFLEAWY